ncbi:hypothetical protein E4U26_001437 [Claviceps purpurea]|nr:hypothetical protein E4U26_001437 [Claviceps purpurea]
MERQGAQKSSNPLKKLPRHKRHRIASQVKTGKTFSTDEVHPNLELSRKYGTANWRHDEGKPIAKPNTATVAELQDQILFYLNEYMAHKTKGRIFHRRFCEDFDGWTRPIWSKVSTPLRTKLRNELENRGVVFSNEFEEESDEASEDRDDIEDPSSADLDDEDPFEYLHQELWEFSTYITEDWYRLGDQPIDGIEREYMEYNLKGRLLHRRFCEDFQGWNAEVWWRANKAIRTKLRNELEQHGLLFNSNVNRVPEKLAELVERRQRPAKASPAGHARRPSPAHTSAPSPTTADSEEELPVNAPEDSSADRQEKEENLSEESASVQPELVLPFTEALSADPVDQTVIDHDMSVAIASKVNLTVPRENEDLIGKNDEETPATELPDLEDSPADPLLIALTVSKGHAADEVRDDPLRRRLEDFEGDFSDAVAVFPGQFKIRVYLVCGKSFPSLYLTGNPMSFMPRQFLQGIAALLGALAFHSVSRFVVFLFAGRGRAG